MKKLLFIIMLIALIGCKTRQTIEQEKKETSSSVSKSTVLDDNSIITIVYDMLDHIDTTRYNTNPGSNVSGYKQKPPDINRHRRGKIVISKTAKSAKTEKIDSTAESIYAQTPKKAVKHVNTFTWLPWAIIALFILIIVIYVKYHSWLQKISAKIRWHTK